ncbi:polysaccharide deacetylase family protein [Flavobacteriaceae bacterium F08102]|nr:polysaccharide deacetylase family protein [Flavobacteriaceae bacterium F08102]
MNLFSKISLTAVIVAIFMIIADLSLPWLVVPFGAWLMVTIIGSFHIRWNYFLKARHRATDRSSGHIALTFDDGPHPEFTPQVLQLLKEYHMKATFFCIGKNIQKYPEIFKQIHEAGHGIGNHSMSHSKSFGFFFERSVLREIKRCDTLIINELGRRNKYFRPPFGVTNPAIAKALKKTQHQVIGWSVRSYDTLRKTPDQICDTVCKRLKEGDVVLLHDTNERTVKALELILTELKNRQLTSVEIATLIN